MTNQFGLDTSYFKSKIDVLQRDISNYTPAELARELARLSKTADNKVLAEPEFVTNEVTLTAGLILELCKCAGIEVKEGEYDSPDDEIEFLETELVIGQNNFGTVACFKDQPGEGVYPLSACEEKEAK